MGVTPHTDRRTVLKSSAAALGLAGTGLGAIALTSEPAAAADVTATFSLSDATYRDEEPPHSPWLRASGTWSYAELDVDPTDWRIRLSAGKSAENQDPVAETTGFPFGHDDSGTFATQGALVDTAAFASTDFEPPADGETITVDVVSTVVFEVLDGDFVLAEASAQGAGVLTVEDTTLTYSASLDATGGWDWQTNESDGTPEL